MNGHILWTAIILVALHASRALSCVFTPEVTYVYDVNHSVTLQLPPGITNINHIDLKYIFGGVKACSSCAETYWGSGMKCELSEIMVVFTDPQGHVVGPPKSCSCLCGGPKWKDDGLSWTYDSMTANSPVLHVPFCHAEYNQSTIVMWYTEDLFGKCEADNRGATQFSFDIDYDVQPQCGDGLCQTNEGCGCIFHHCPEDCKGVDLQCPDPVPILAQNFTGPAVLKTVWDTKDAWALWVDVQIPHATPERCSISFAFVEPKTGKQVGNNLPWTNRQCAHQFQHKFEISELIAKYKPLMVTSDTTYFYQFDIQARWAEKYWLSADTPVLRWRNDTLHFAVVVPRNVTLRSVVKALCQEQSLWGYLAKGSIMLPHNSSSIATIHLELITEVQTPSYCIDKTSFKFVLSTGGHLLTVSNPTLKDSTKTSVHCVQTWSFDATFNASGICSLTANDQMTFTFTVSSCESGYASSTGKIVAGLGGLENFCSVNQTARLLGTQLTFDGPDCSSKETHYFFCGQTLFVRDFVKADCLNVSNTSVESVVLRGPALGASGSETDDFPLWNKLGQKTAIGKSVNYCQIKCPAGYSANWACYTITLPCCNGVVTCGKEFTIETGLKITIMPQTGRKRDSAATYDEDSGEQSMVVSHEVATGMPEASDVDGAPFFAASLCVLAVVMPLIW